MATERYALAGLSTPRADWFTRVAWWANSSTLPIDFVKCVSQEELRMRIKAGQKFSAVLVDAQLPFVDREFLELINCTLAIIGSAADQRVAGAKYLPETFERADLASFLTQHCKPSHSFISLADTLEPSREYVASRAKVIGVTGSGGTGASTVAMMIAQSLGNSSEYLGNVVLLDGKRHPELAMLHDTVSVTPSIHELADTCKKHVPTNETVRDHTFYVPSRNYDILLGSQTSLGWATLRPPRIDLTMTALCSAYSVVIADIEPEFDGESTVGSADIEEFNYLNRYIAQNADQLVVVGRGTAKGLASLNRVIADSLRFDIAVEKLVPVIVEDNFVRTSKTVITKTLLELSNLPATTNVLFVPFLTNIESIHRDVATFPMKACSQLQTRRTFESESAA